LISYCFPIFFSLLSNCFLIVFQLLSHCFLIVFSLFSSCCLIFSSCCLIVVSFFSNSFPIVVSLFSNRFLIVFQLLFNFFLIVVSFFPIVSQFSNLIRFLGQLSSIFYRMVDTVACKRRVSGGFDAPSNPRCRKDIPCNSFHNRHSLP